MWLINVETLRLEEFVGRNIPPYAVLSHTWGDEEVTYKDITDSFEAAKKKAGFQKIQNTCRLAEERGIGYAWVDTCCIDKSNSAELSESINSMFKWYRDSQVCYAYLSDVPKRDMVLLRKSRWFKRGWTLQELIAPGALQIFDATWDLIGDRESCIDDIAAVTGIDGRVIGHPERLPTFSVAMRMSWAATRETTREEDIAYCLIGIFDINMPLLYGEGDKAFIRLQEEIIKAYHDMTILCWWTALRRILHMEC